MVGKMKTWLAKHWINGCGNGSFNMKHYKRLTSFGIMAAPTLAPRRLADDPVMAQRHQPTDSQ